MPRHLSHHCHHVALDHDILVDSSLTSNGRHLTSSSFITVLVRKELIQGVPDGIVNMWNKHNTRLQRLWLMECAFSQSDKDVMEKLHAYVLKAPDLLVVCKIVFNQAPPYHSSGSRAHVAQQLWLSALMMEAEWRDHLSGDDKFTLVVIDSHTWLSLSSVMIHVWVHQPGDSDINLNCVSGDGYAVGVSRFASFNVLLTIHSHWSVTLPRH